MIENTEWSVSSLGRATGWAFVALSVGAIAGVSIGGLVAPHAVPLAALLVVAGIAAPFGWAFYRVTIVPAIIATRQDLLIINHTSATRSAGQRSRESSPATTD